MVVARTIIRMARARIAIVTPQRLERKLFAMVYGSCCFSAAGAAAGAISGGAIAAAAIWFDEIPLSCTIVSPSEASGLGAIYSETIF